MEIIGVVILFFIALLIGALFFYGFKTRTPWGAFWIFLMFLFLAALVGRFWITPVGPVTYGVAWLPIVFFVFMIALIIAATAPVQDRRTTEKVVEPDITKPDAKGAIAAFGLFFWLMLLFFIIAIIAGLTQIQ